MRQVMEPVLFAHGVDMIISAYVWETPACMQQQLFLSQARACV